jgi:hypothetical protein
MVHHIVQRPTFLGQNGISEYSKIVPCDCSFLVPECWLGLLCVIYLQQDYLVRIIDGRHQWIHLKSLLQHTMGSSIEDVVGQVILLETRSSQLSADKGRLAFACCESRRQGLPHRQWVLLTVFAWLSWIFILFMQVFPGVQVCQSPCSLCLFICSRTTNICTNQQVSFASFPPCCVIMIFLDCWILVGFAYKEFSPCCVHRWNVDHCRAMTLYACTELQGIRELIYWTCFVS